MNISGTEQFVLAQAMPNEQIQSFIPLLLILGVFYFLLVRPQQQKAKEHQEFVDNLKRNDRVVTRGGLHGRITELREKDVMLEIAPNVKVRHDRDQLESASTDGKEG